MMLTNDLITPDNVSKDLLKAIYDAAFIETAWDDDGDLKIKDELNCTVMISENQTRIMIFTVFEFEEGFSREQKLDLVNKINDEYAFVRASLTEYDTLLFDYSFYLKGGLTKKNLVLGTRFFQSIPLEAIHEHGKEMVA